MNILSQQEISQFVFSAPTFIFILAILIGFVCIAALLAILFCKDKEDFKAITIISAFIIPCFGMGLSASLWLPVTPQYIEYKVTIDDTVKFIEFNAQYEIIDQEGQIYTIKERTPAQ